MPAFVNPVPFGDVSNGGGFGGGFLAGLNQDYSNQFNNQSLSDEALQHQIQQVLLQKNQSDLGVTQADNVNKILAAGVTKGLYDNGTETQRAQEAANADIALSQQKTISTKDQVRAAMAPITVDTANFFENQGGFDPNNPTHLAKWNAYAQAAEQHGIQGVPAAPGPSDLVQLQDFGQKANQYIASSKSAAIESIPYAQAMAETQAKEKGATGRTAMTVAGNKDVEAQRSTTALGVADKNYEGRVVVAQMAQQRAASDALQIRLIADKANARPGGWTAEDVGMVEYLQTQIRFNSEAVKLGTMINFQTPAARRQMEEDAKKDAINDLSALPEYVAAKKKFGSATSNIETNPTGGTAPVAPTASTPTDNVLKQAVERTGQPYEPDKYNYRIFNGQTQRSPK